MNTSSGYKRPYKYLKAILFTIAMIGLFLLMVWARAFYGSVQSYDEGEARMEKGEYMGAITFFDRSLHWYTPFNPYITKSAENLWWISELAEEAGDTRLAIIAARTLRRGFISARSFYVSGKDWIERCDGRIDYLMERYGLQDGSAEKKVIGKGSVPDSPVIKAPDVLWTLMLIVGLLGWIGTAIGLIISPFRADPEKGIFNFSTLKWIVLWASFFAIWILGMMKA